MRPSLKRVAFVLGLVVLATPRLATAAPPRQRLIVLTDIEADPDDTDKGRPALSRYRRVIVNVLPPG